MKLGKDKKTKSWVIITIVIIFLLGFYFLFYRNVILHIHDLNAKIEKLNTQIKLKTRLAKRLNEYKAELIDIKEGFTRFSNYLIKSDEISDYLVKIGDFFTEYNIKPTTFQPGKEEFSENKIYGRFPVTLEFQCDYFTLIKLLDKLENSNKIIYVNSIKISPLDRNLIDVNLVIFLLLKKEGIEF